MPVTSHETTIAFDTSGFTAEITNFTPPGWSVESIPTTHAGTADAKTFMPGDLPDNGELQFTIHFNEDAPPTRGPAEDITITFKSGATWEFSGFMMEYAPGGTSTEGDEKIEADVTVKVSGPITVTPA